MNRRKERLEKALREIISTAIARELQDPRLTFCSIHEIKLSPDNRYAQVFVSFIGDENANKQGIEGLRSASKILQKIVASQLKIRVTPILRFELDNTIAQRIALVHHIEEIAEQENNVPNDPESTDNAS